jgi:transcriptional regulator with XRE-family HTH domain
MIISNGSGSMDQEKIGKFIKQIRKDNNLTQKQLADKLGVTYQAVSKWENGKNIPDIAILNLISQEFKINIDDILNGKSTKKNNKKKIIMIGIFLIVIIFIIVLFIILNKNNNDFYFNKLSATCENFNLYGTIAYNENKTSIHISNISYCGDTDLESYQKIECTLYEVEDDTKTKITSYSYQEEETISLVEFLKNVDFNVEHYSKSCKMYQENGLMLEIEATNKENKTTYYEIPLKLEENCN